MAVLRLIAACVAAALLCTVIRVQRPELATAVALGAGAAVLAALAGGLSGRMPELESVWSMLGAADAELRDAVLRAAGIAVAAELGAQLCADAGESAMAGRIVLAARVAILGLCLPLMASLAESLGGLLS